MLNKIIEKWIGEEVQNNLPTQGESICACEYRQALQDLKSRIPELEEMIVGEIEKVDTPIFEGASGFSYNSGWNDGEKSGRYHLKADIINSLKGDKDTN